MWPHKIHAHAVRVIHDIVPLATYSQHFEHSSSYALSWAWMSPVIPCMHKKERPIIVKLSLTIQSRVLHRGSTLESACQPRILFFNIRGPHFQGYHTPGPLRTIWSWPLPLPNNHSCLIMYTVRSKGNCSSVYRSGLFSSWQPLPCCSHSKFRLL